MSTKKDIEKITDNDVDNMILGYGRGSSLRSKVTTLTEVLNLDYNEYCATYKEEEAAESVQQPEADTIRAEDQAEPAEDFDEL